MATEKKEVIRKPIINKIGKVQYLPVGMADKILATARSGREAIGNKVKDAANLRYVMDDWRELTPAELQAWMPEKPAFMQVAQSATEADQIAKMKEKDADIEALKKELEALKAKEKPVKLPEGVVK